MWEIFAYHNSDGLTGILNAVAAIMASGTYASAVALVLLVGSVAALVAYATDPGKLHGWRWLVTVVMVQGVLFLPRVTVGVVDKTGGAPVRVVGNVPLGVAALGSLTSSVGNAITELFETAFQVLPGPAALPSELAYERNGIMFGSRLIQETRQATIQDPGLRTDLLNFVHNCTMLDIADGAISASAFAQSGDVWRLMASTNPARFSTVTTATGLSTNTCDAVYASIDARLPAEMNVLTGYIGQRLHPTLGSAAARAAIVDQIPQAYIRGQIAAASTTAADLIRQNAVINAINDAGELGCQKLDDPACTMLAMGRAQAVAAQNAAWINGAKVAEQALPVVRNVAEALMYAVFPLVVLMLFLSTGRTATAVLMGYVVALVSIQLWPPLFAVLNYLASLYSQLDQAAAADLGSGLKSLSLRTSSSIYAGAISGQAVVSYLVMGIPLIAYSLANRMANFGSAVMGGVQGMQSTSMSGNATSSAAVGNVNTGNVSMDQRNVSPSTSSPWVQRQQSDNGNWVTTNAAGEQAIDFLRNQGAVSRVVSTSVSQGMVDEASQAADSARSESVSARSELSSSLTQAMTTASSRFRGTTRQDGMALSSDEQAGLSADKLRSITDQVASSTGLSSSQVSDIAFRLSGGVGVPGASPFRAGADASAGKSYRSDLNAQEQLVMSHLDTSQLRQFKSFADRATHDQSFQRSLGADTRDGRELASRLSEGSARVQSADATYAERQQVAERLSAARQNNETLSVDLAALPQNHPFMQRYNDLAQQYGSDSHALQAMMASELAPYALPVTHRPNGAMNMATTPDALRAGHVADTHDARFDPQRVREAHVAHDRGAAPRVSSRGLEPPVVNGVLETVRRDLTAQHEAGRDAPNLKATFDQRNEIVRNADGTVSSRKSQGVANVKQMRDDAAATFRNAGDALFGWDKGKGDDKPGDKGGTPRK